MRVGARTRFSSIHIHVPQLVRRGRLRRDHHRRAGAYKSASPTASHWASSSDIEFGHTVYIGLSAVILNLAIAVVLTVIFRAVKVPQGADETLPHQYIADIADVPVPAHAGVGAAGAAGDLP